MMKPRHDTDEAPASTAHAFEIFGILIAWKIATARGVFTILQERLRRRADTTFPVEFVEDFYGCRCDAERFVRNENQNKAVTLEQVYRRMHRPFRDAVSWEVFRELIDIEIETEIDCCIPVELNIRKACDLLDRGETVALVANTLLPEKNVRNLLETFCPRLAGCPLDFTPPSGRSGNRDFRHPLHLTFEPGAVENAYFREDRLFHQLYAGAVRSFRGEHPDATPKQLLGATLGGPILYGFVEDTLKKATDSGIERLYFFARDGQVLLRIAREINRVRELGLDLRYLCCARQVCHFAAIFRFHEGSFDEIAADNTRHTLEEIALRLHMTPGELTESLPETLKSRLPKPDAPISRPILNSLKRFLLEDEVFCKTVETRAAVLRERFLAYLAQEGIFNVDLPGIVDMGWTGKMQDSFFKVARSRKRDFRMIGFYFAATPVSSGTSSRNAKRSYLCPPDVRVTVNALELLASADHGTTFDYQENDDGVFRPVFRNAEHLLRWGVDEMQYGIEGFTQRYLNSVAKFGDPGVEPKAVLEPLLRLLDRPDRMIAETLGSLPFSNDQNDRRLHEAAPRLTLRTLIAYALGDAWSKNDITHWKAASLVRSGLRIVLLHEILYGTSRAMRAVFRPVASFLARLVRVPAKYVSAVLCRFQQHGGRDGV